MGWRGHEVEGAWGGGGMGWGGSGEVMRSGGEQCSMQYLDCPGPEELSTDPGQGQGPGPVGIRVWGLGFFFPRWRWTLEEPSTATDPVASMKFAPPPSLAPSSLPFCPHPRPPCPCLFLGKWPG